VTRLCSALRNATASPALRKSGSVTISSSGVPARFRSMPVMPWKSSCRDFPSVLLEVGAGDADVMRNAAVLAGGNSKAPAADDGRSANWLIW
jgi:hypothetical protein